MPDHAQRFRELFGRDPELTASAPGRVNLIGEHTDYHEGYVLPTVIPQRTTVDGAIRSDGVVRVWSRELDTGVVDYIVGAERRGRGWLDYIQGVTATLARRGHAGPGADVMIRSDVPAGAGVSSSAALAVALLRLLRQLWRVDLDDVTIARVAQLSETEFVGAPVGIMDPMACSVGGDGEALFLDTRTLDHHRVPIPAAVELVVIDSGVTHHHAGGQYATRRRESFAAAAHLGVSHLRDADLTMLAGTTGLAPVLMQRARHVITENGRVLDTRAALAAADLVRTGALLNASHASMRDDYQISTPEIDALVAIGQSHADVYGARMTGGGFGGAVVMLARRGAGDDIVRAVISEYRSRTGLNGSALMPQTDVPN